MGNVSIVVKIFIEDPAKLEEIKEKISKKMNVIDSRIEEIGFGVKALKIMVIVPDKEGGDIEEKLNMIDGVSEVQVESMTLV